MTTRFKLLISGLLLLSIAIPILSRTTDWLERVSNVMQEFAELELFAAAFVGLVILPFRNDIFKFTQLMNRLAVRYLEAMGDHIWVAVGIAFGVLLIQISPDKSEKLSYGPGVMQKLNSSEIQPRVNIDSKMASNIKTLNQDLYRATLLNILYQNSPQGSRRDSEVLLRLMDVEPPKATRGLRQVTVMELIKLEQAAGRPLDLSGAFLDELDLSNQSLKEHNLEGALKNADFSSASLLDVNFRGSNLQGANFSNATLLLTQFYDADLVDANFEAADLQAVDFKGAKLRGARLYQSDLTQTFFKGAYLNGALVDSLNWLNEYQRLNPNSQRFPIKQHSVVEQQDADGNPVYVITGIDPPVEARKPDLEQD